MKLEVLKKQKNFLEFKILGERHTFPNLLKSKLLEDKSVNFVSYKLEHPQNTDAIFVVKTKEGDPKKVLSKACKGIEKELNDFQKQIKKVLK